jgi:hypothetical protein
MPDVEFRCTKAGAGNVYGTSYFLLRLVRISFLTALIARSSFCLGAPVATSLTRLTARLKSRPLRLRAGARRHAISTTFRLIGCRRGSGRGIPAHNSKRLIAVSSPSPVVGPQCPFPSSHPYRRRSFRSWRSAFAASSLNVSGTPNSVSPSHTRRSYRPNCSSLTSSGTAVLTVSPHSRARSAAISRTGRRLPGARM